MRSKTRREAVILYPRANSLLPMNHGVLNSGVRSSGPTIHVALIHSPAHISVARPKMIDQPRGDGAKLCVAGRSRMLRVPLSRARGRKGGIAPAASSK